MSSPYSVLIAGGGPVGWACALAARSALGRAQRIAVIERQSAPEATRSGQLSARVYTVATGNLDWLRGLGVVFVGRLRGLAGPLIGGVGAILGFLDQA